MLIFDAHLDLSMNALEWNRDLTRPIAEIRAREKDQQDKADRGHGTVCLPEMRRGQVGICVATQIARYVKPTHPLSGWHSPAQAWAQTQGQLAWYRAMEERGEMFPITNQAGLAKMIKLWQPSVDSPAESATAAPRPIGYVLSLEGADSMVTLQHLERSFAQGLRAIGPAHYGPGTYAPGTEATGPLSPAGRELIKEMNRLGLILDCTHLSDEAFWEATKLFHGPLWASHQNCRALVPGVRQFDDAQIKTVIERGGVLGTALDAWMLVPGWVKNKTRPSEVGVKCYS
jgi:membrane dipeptidase